MLWLDCELDVTALDELWELSELIVVVGGFELLPDAKVFSLACELDVTTLDELLGLSELVVVVGGGVEPPPPPPPQAVSNMNDPAKKTLQIKPIADTPFVFFLKNLVEF